MSDKTTTAPVRRTIDIDMVAAAVALEIWNRFGFMIGTSPQNASRTRGGEEFFELDAPKDYGIFKTVIKDANVKVRAGKVKEGEEDEHLCVFVALHYEHVSGGSNGSNIGTMWLNYDASVIGFREG